MSTRVFSTVQNLPTNPCVNYRVINKVEKERRYEQLFPPYHPNKQYVIYFINSLTTEEELKFLCDATKCATHFIFDTESDIDSRQPAIIQILILQPDPEPSPILLIQTSFLPDRSSLCFRAIQKLFHYLFRNGTNLYSWGSLEDELTRFRIYQLFSLHIPSRIFNVQRIFTGWFNEYLNTKSNDNNNNNTTDYDDSVIINAPEIDPELLLPPVMMKVKLNELKIWSLQISSFQRNFIS